jgi:UDP-N-acetylmuramate dehydrogenase
MTSVPDLIDRGLVEEAVPLGPLTTYKAGGPARWLVTVPDRASLDEIIASGLFRDRPVLVIGRGSNLVVSDEGFPGAVVRLGEGFTAIEFEGLEVVAGGAVPLPRLARATADRGLTGLEFFVGVPGSVGGAVRQNAGCFGSETRDRLVSAEIVDLDHGGVSILDSDDLELSYRHSNLGPHQLVISARFAAEPGDRIAAGERIREITRWRRDHQPGGTLNAGSVFKNPEGISAGELIDSLGLKGLSCGEVSVSTKHANFFVAGPGARARDILALVDLVKDRVFEATGTILEPEIQFVGFDR